MKLGFQMSLWVVNRAMEVREHPLWSGVIKVIEKFLQINKENC